MRPLILAVALLAIALPAQKKYMQSKLIIFDPGHFHATLLQKDMYPWLDPRVTVYALTRFYDAWSFQVLPRLGRMVAGDEDSYRYLAESIRTFPDQKTLAGMMREAGLVRVKARNLSAGIAAIHSGWRL